MEIIVALDCEIDKAKNIVDILKDRISIFKIGPVLFTRYGFSFIEWINLKGCRVFLDMKLHDIPNTVKNTVKNLKNTGIYSLSVHISGGISMLEAAKEGSDGKIKIWGVSILTSIDHFEYSKIGFRYSLEHQVLHFAKIAQSCAIDGIVCSPRELGYVKKYINGLKFITPSIRLKSESNFGDQKRFMTPSQACKAGADYIVIGRPVTESNNPLSVIDDIKGEIDECNENS